VSGASFVGARVLHPRAAHLRSSPQIQIAHFVDERRLRAMFVCAM